jgi:hypothetical protein
MCDAEKDHPAIEVGVIGSGLTYEARRLYDLAQALSFVGMAELSEKLVAQSERIQKHADNLQTCSNQLVGLVVRHAQEGSNNMIAAALAVVNVIPLAGVEPREFSRAVVPSKESER